jgi:histidine ammonia-lyase
VLLRRQDRHGDAAAAWQEVLELAAREGGRTALGRRAALALAIHHEHRARDFKAAKRYADALRREATGRTREDAERRVDRLKRKIGAVKAPRPLLDG